jgi:hypothetical protein
VQQKIIDANCLQATSTQFRCVLLPIHAEWFVLHRQSSTNQKRSSFMVSALQIIISIALVAPLSADVRSKGEHRCTERLHIPQLGYALQTTSSIRNIIRRI